MATTNWWLGRALMLAVGLASVAMARQGVVKTSDGRTIEGDVVENPDAVTITRRGIDTVVPRGQVAVIEYGGDAEAALRARLDALDAKDFDGRIKLAREAFEGRKYEVARDAIESALIINPNSREAVDFSQMIRRQMQLEAAKANGAKPDTTATPLAPPGTVERRTLSADDINSIRQAELKSSVDADVRIRFDKDVRKRFASTANLNYNDFLALSSLDQAQQIFTQGDAKLRKDVRILSDPAALREFKQVVQPVVLRNCATSGCHGGDGAGGFVLYNTAVDNEATAYTNFYILQQYTKQSPTQTPAGGVFSSSGAQIRMIDRTRADNSLIVQYALPTNVAEYDHPQVQGYRPGFNTPQDRSAARIIDWVRGSLAAIEPNYGVSYTPPTGKGPTTQPATTP